MRSLSGIVSVTAITKEFPCPGRCIYCPNEERGCQRVSLSNEPACMRVDFE